MTKFDSYTDSILSAFTHNPNSEEVVNKKTKIVSGVYEFYNHVPESVLFVGFNPVILSSNAKEIWVTEISEWGKTELTKHNVKFKYIEYSDLYKLNKNFDAVVALDEYFTFAESDQEQQQQIKLFCNLTRGFVISTLRDYKNQDYKDREYSQPVLLRSGTEKITYIESHDWDFKDRSSWKTTVYEIDQTKNSLANYGPFSRRTMYFKQLAKFSLDAGANNFFVHKNLMYKSLVKKNYEHVISITFDEL